MFANVIDAIQGPATQAVADEQPPELKEERTTASDEEKAAKGSSSTQTKEPVQSKAFSFWGVANALADSVKKTTADLSASVVETDWKAEIEAFRKGVADDASEVQKHAQIAAREGASRLEHLPQHAAKARLPPMDPNKVKAHFDQVGSSLGRFGTQMLAGSKDIFEQVSEAVQAELDGIEGHISRPRKGATTKTSKQGQKETPKYSRLEAEISAMQRNSSTYCDQPEDPQDFAKWLQGFKLENKTNEIAAITKENAFMAELQSRIVPLIVQYEVFWTRYFYQLDQLKQKHEQRQSVAKLAVLPPAEQVSWDDEEEEGQLGAASGSAHGRVGRDTSPPEPQAAAPKPKEIAATTAVSTAAQPKAAAPLHEDEPDTSTASEDSSNAPWTVVTSPTHKRHDSGDATSRPSPVPEEPSAETEDTTKAITTSGPEPKSAPEKDQAPKADDKGAKEEDEMTIDLSDEEGVPEGEGNGSEVEEDWGLWD